MKRILSNQLNILFVLCGSPITIDKSAEWGANNLQLGPKGAFLKLNEDGSNLSVSHLVQPNEETTAPIGWVPATSGEPNRFDKAPIWVGKALTIGDTVPVQTADGLINYEVKEAAYLCYNDLNGAPNEADCWAQTEKNLVKNYQFEAVGA